MTYGIDKVASGLKAVNKAIQEPPRMTLQERIADWISGGALTEARNHVLYEAGWRERACDVADVLVREQRRLDRIAAQETPCANATVKRMARIARGEE